MNPKHLSNEDVLIPEALTECLTARVVNYDTMAVSVDVADNALDQFIVKGKNHPNGTLITLLSIETDYTTPSYLVTYANGDITTQAANSTGVFIMDVTGLYDVKVYAASGNVAGSTVSVFASLK